MVVDGVINWFYMQEYWVELLFWEGEMVGMLGREQSNLFIAQYLSAAQFNSSDVETSSALSTI